MKICSSCKIEKSLGHFNNNKSARDGKQWQCKECHKKNWNHRKYSEAGKQYYQNNKEKSAERQRRRLYNLNQEEYNEILKAQNYGCAICGYNPKEKEKSLGVDHDHSCCPGKKSCGKCIRGLLCDNHNKTLGLIKEDISTLHKMEDYLRKYSEDTLYGWESEEYF